MRSWVTCSEHFDVSLLLTSDVDINIEREVIKRNRTDKAAMTSAIKYADNVYIHETINIKLLTLLQEQQKIKTTFIRTIKHNTAMTVKRAILY